MPNNKFKPCRKPINGSVWNPLKCYHRNLLCLCGSGIKFKKCCLHKMPVAIPIDVALKMKNRNPNEAYKILLDYCNKAAEYEIRKAKANEVMNEENGQT